MWSVHDEAALKPACSASTVEIKGSLIRWSITFKTGDFDDNGIGPLIRKSLVKPCCVKEGLKQTSIGVGFIKLRWYTINSRHLIAWE